MAVAAKKVVAKKLAKPERLIILRSEVVPVDGLHLYHKNPNVGDIDEIAISLNENGQYKPIVVNIGTKTGRPMEILAGNHTYLATRKEVTYDGPDGKMRKKDAWGDIYAAFVDVGEAQATRIVIADNETAAKAQREARIVAELLASIPPMERMGTGFNLQETEDIVAQAARDAEDALARADAIRQQHADEDHRRAVAKTFSGAPLGEEGDYEDDEDDDSPGMHTGPKLEDAKEELEGMFAFKAPENLFFPGVGPFEIPLLRDDMLMTFDELPDNLDSWAGSACKNWPDPDQWWLYNWGIDSTSGMQDISKVIVSFYAFDHYFDGWWYKPEKYTAKVLNSGIKYILTPNFSQSTDLPKVESLWALYRARWLGRYFQEAGLKLIPDITWRDGDMEWLKRHVLGTLKTGMPMIAMQMQTIDPKEVTGGIEHFEDQVRLVFETLKPEAALIYAGNAGTELVQKVAPKGIKLRFIETRMKKLSELAKGRERKKTI